MDEATKTVLTAFYVAISNIESSIAGSEKPMKLGEAKNKYGVVYASLFSKMIVKFARNRVYNDFTAATGESVPKEVIQKLGSPFIDWLLS